MVIGVGVIAAAGDLADLMYIGVLAVGNHRCHPRALAATWNGTGVARDGARSGVGHLIALIAGNHLDPFASVVEILGLNGLFIALFLGPASCAAGRDIP